MPWQDYWGSVVVLAISIFLAENAFRQGRYDYKTGFLFSLGNIAVSFFILIANFGSWIGGWLAIPYFFALSTISYFAWLGGSVTFRLPKSVKCFQCQYVDFPHETDEPMTSYDELQQQQFRKLHYDFDRQSKTESVNVPDRK